jgi:hypothetical protein
MRITGTKILESLVEYNKYEREVLFEQISAFLGFLHYLVTSPEGLPTSLRVRNEGRPASNLAERNP